MKRYEKPKALVEQDFLDAVEFAGFEADEELDPEDFEISDGIWLGLSDLYDFADVDAWSEWGQGELLEMTREEQEEELTRYRGAAWAKGAMSWTPSTMSPIVVVELLSGFTTIGDGRGRVSYAVGMDLDLVPAVIVKQVRK